MTAEERAALKLNIDEAKFLEAVDREGDHEIGVGSAMTADRRAALVEKVAIAIYQTWCAIHGVAETSLPWSEIDDEERDACVAEATAAIDLIRAEVLEEAARVAEDCSVALNGTYEAIHIAAAIRALKEKAHDR